MVKVDDSWPPQQNSAWNSPNLNYKNTLPTFGEKSGLRFCMKPVNFSLNETSPEFAALGLPGFKTGQTNEAYGLLPNFPTRYEKLLSIPYPNLKEKQPASSAELGVKTTPNLVSESNQKRFLIFDRSGDQTRLFLTPIHSPVQNPSITSTVPVRAFDLHYEKGAANIERISPIMPIIEDISDKNDAHDGSEMREDTEEINALLSSDEDKDGDDDDDDDDEVTSTDRSPFVIEGSYEKRELVEEIMEGVASFDGLTKRRRLSDGGFKKLSFMGIASSAKLDRTYDDDDDGDDDAESRCVKGSTQEEKMGSILSNKCPMKDKIRKTLKILESIVPGVKSKDPLLVIDEAINYLKLLKLKAKALRVDYS